MSDHEKGGGAPAALQGQSCGEGHVSVLVTLKMSIHSWSEMSHKRDLKGRQKI